MFVLFQRIIEEIISPIEGVVNPETAPAVPSPTRK